MKRIDRLLDECRLLRMARARRAGDLNAAARADWQGECEVAGSLLAALSENGPAGRVPTEGRLPIDVLDLSPLAPLIERLRTLVLDEITASAAAAAVVAGTLPRIDAYLGALADTPASRQGREIAARRPVRPPVDAARVGRGAIDPARKRRSAMEDVAVLAVEAALFEVLRQVVEANDAARGSRDLAYVDTLEIDVAAGRVRRARRSGRAAPPRSRAGLPPGARPLAADVPEGAGPSAPPQPAGSGARAPRKRMPRPRSAEAAE